MLKWVQFGATSPQASKLVASDCDANIDKCLSCGNVVLSAGGLTLMILNSLSVAAACRMSWLPVMEQLVPRDSVWSELNRGHVLDVLSAKCSLSVH